MVSLYKASTGGDDWGNIGDPLKQTGTIYYVLFMLHIGFIAFSVLNILTGIFLEKTSQASARDMHKLKEETADREEEDIRMLKQLFRVFDENGSGLISKEEEAVI